MLKKVAGVVVSLPLMVATAAHAAVPLTVTTAMDDMKTDALAVATAFLIAAIAVIAFLYMRRGAK